MTQRTPDQSASRRVVWALALMLMLLPALPGQGQGQESRGQRVRPTQTSRKVALVIGNGGYSVGRLPNPVNDARSMAQALGDLGFVVIQRTELTKSGMENALGEFSRQLTPGCEAVFYFAGHGMEVEGRNFLFPIDAQVDRLSDVKLRTVDLDTILSVMDDAQTRLNIVILDACRNNPYGRGIRSGGGGLANIKAPTGTLIAYATAPKETASDGNEGNGLYTQELLRAMREPNLPVEMVFKQVRTRVRERSGGNQVPWESSSLEGEFYFAGNRTTSTPTTTSQPGIEVERVTPLGTLVVTATTAGAELSVDGKVIGTSRSAGEKFRIRNVEAGTVRVRASKSGKPDHVKTAEVRGDQETEVQIGWPDELAKTYRNSIGMEFVLIPAGTFMMGSPTSEEGRGNDETQHQVRISQGFYLGKYEVTQGEWEAVMGSNPSYFKGNPKLPVEQVSWNDVQEFIRKLNEREGREVYRLPSEAEWEYACRAGTSGDYAGNLDAMGWYDKNAGGKTHAVGEKSPNGWGLYDMHGNVWEWCEDWYEESYYQKSPSEDPRGPSEGSGRVIRGGGWGSDAVSCRSAYRNIFVPGSRSVSLGFRLLRIGDR